MAKEKGAIWKRIGAIIAGFLTGALLSVGTDMFLGFVGVNAARNRPVSDYYYVWPIGYRFIFNIAGCYLAARLAPFKPMWHAMVIGWFGLALATAATVATWSVVPSMGPHWYAVVVALISVPCAWLGGKFYLMGEK